MSIEAGMGHDQFIGKIELYYKVQLNPTSQVRCRMAPDGSVKMTFTWGLDMFRLPRQSDLVHGPPS